MAYEYKKGIYRDKEVSPCWYFEFVCNGRRHRGTTGETDERKARQVARDRKEAAQVERAVAVAVEGGSLELGAVVLRYLSVMGEKLAEVRNVHRDLNRIRAFFKAQGTPDKLMTAITGRDVLELVTWRKKHRAVPPHPTKNPEEYPTVSAGTVNHTVVRMQALFKFAREGEKDERGETIRRYFPHEPVWKDYKQPVPERKARTLVPSEDKKLAAATRDDHTPLFEFARLSAFRFESCVFLSWSEVRWGEGVISKPGKQLPSGKEKIETIPITPEIRAILKSLEGDHKDYVFTYVAQRTRDGRKRGQRYPFTYQGAATAFRRTVKKAEIEKFSFHGLRRTRGTEILKSSNLAVAQKLLNHRHVTTTMKYLNVDVKDVAEAMDKADRKRGAKAGRKRGLKVAA